MVEEIVEDLKRNQGNIKGQMITFMFRVTSFFAKRRGSLIWFLGIPVMVFYRLIVEWLLGVELPAKTRIAPGLVIYHGQGLVVNDGTVIGKNVILRHCTTIGNRLTQNGTPSACPIIGDNVEIGSNVVIIGPIKIGNNSKIGAGSVIVKDVPPDTTAIGNPARFLQHSNSSSRHNGANTC